MIFAQKNYLFNEMVDLEPQKVQVSIASAGSSRSRNRKASWAVKPLPFGNGWERMEGGG